MSVLCSLLKVCLSVRSGLCADCWLWFNREMQSLSIATEVIFHRELQTRALSQHTGIIRDDAVRLQRRAGIRISPYIPQREKCFLDMLNLSSFQRADAPHPSNGAQWLLSLPSHAGFCSLSPLLLSNIFLIHDCLCVYVALSHFSFRVSLSNCCALEHRNTSKKSPWIFTFY